MAPPSQHTRAVGMLILMNVFWGLSFPLSKAIEELMGRLVPSGSGFFVTAYTIAPRYVIAVAVFLVLSRIGRHRDAAPVTRNEVKHGLIMGLFNVGGMLFQMDGLRLTAASTSAFLTLIYAVLIPIWISIRFRRNPGLIIWIACAMVLAGVAILGRFDWHTLRLGRGEVETLLGAIMFMGQIISLSDEKYAGNRPDKTTVVMFIFETPIFMVVLLATMPHAGALLVPWTSPAWIGLILALTAGPTLLGYSLMNTWQPKITATEAGLLNCSEPVFTSLLVLFLPALLSVWAGIAYPNEHASLNLLVGGGLITLANVLIQLKPAAAIRATACVLFLILMSASLRADEPVVRDLGVPVISVNWVRLHPGRGPDGRASLLASMGQNNGGLFVLDIDLATGHCRQFAAPSATEQYPTASFRSPRTGVLYVAAHTDGYLLRYDPAHAERGLEDLGAIDGDQAIFPMGIGEAPDGGIWIGAYPGCGLTRFDPPTGRFAHFGSMDNVDKYLCPLCGDDGSIAALTKVVHPHLVLFDPRTGNHRSVGPVNSPEDPSQHIRFFKGVDGLLYLDTEKGYFRVKGGEFGPVATLPAAMPGIDATDKHDYQETLPMPGGLIASWADGADGAAQYRQVRLSSADPSAPPRIISLDWRGSGTNIFLIHAGADGNIYGSSFLPELLFRCAPDGSGMVNLGRCSTALGEAFSMGNLADGRIMIASYIDSEISIYDPRKPMHFGLAEGDNPRGLGRLDEVGLRPEAMIIAPPLTGPRGEKVPERMWIGSAPYYGFVGGTMAWLDPRTGAHGSHRNIVQDCTPSALAWIPKSGEILVGFSTESGTGAKVRAKNGAFAIWDATADRPVYIGNFGLQDMADVIALAPAGDGLFYALIGRASWMVKDLGAEPIRGPRLALIDPGTRRVVAESWLPATFGSIPERCQYCFRPGPGGAAYGVTATCLYRVKPGTCEADVVWRAPAGDKIDFMGPWIGRTLYFATGWRLRTLTLP